MYKNVLHWQCNWNMSVTYDVSMCCLIGRFHDRGERGFACWTVGLAKWHVFSLTVLVMSSMIICLHPWKLLAYTLFSFVATNVTSSLYVAYCDVFHVFEICLHIIMCFCCFCLFMCLMWLTYQLWLWPLHNSYGLCNFHINKVQFWW
jgi:hypothetical protein